MPGTVLGRVAAAAFVLALAGMPVGAAAPEPVLIPAWKVVGPFESGSREGFVQPLADSSGVVPRVFTYTETYPSVLADGGRVGWKDVAADRAESGALTGRTSLKFENVAWDARESEWGGAALLNAAHASATVSLAQDGLYLLEATRCSVALNGVAIAGDPYGQGIAQAVVRGRAGLNDILVSTTGFGAERAFELKLTPLDAGELIRIASNDALVPDLVEGVRGSGFVGVPLVSASTKWEAGLRLIVDGAMTGVADAPSAIPPLGSLKVAVPVTWSATARGANDDHSRVGVRIRVLRRDDDTTLASATVKADVRRAEQPRSETFLSRLDGSAQKYGLLPAGAGGPERKALILSLHGASADARGQAASYSPKNWAVIVAPTNRRPYGFDWQDWGALDAEEVLALALERLPIDRERIHLAGHSMGGHGTWTFGVSHAGTFASIAPSAGWNSYDTYLPPTLRRSLAFAPPELAELWQRGLSAGRVSTHLESLLSTPTFVLQGGADDNVPPTQARLLAGELERLGGDVSYREVPGMGHWWDIDKDRPGADCVDSAELEAFWRAHVLNRWPRRVILTSADPDVARTASWLTLVTQERVGEISRIEAETLVPEIDVKGGRVKEDIARVVVSTRNVLRFEMHLAPRLVPEGDVDVAIDWRLMRVKLGPGKEVVTCWRAAGLDSTWSVNVGNWQLNAAPLPLVPGGIEKALYEPFTIVVGTLGDDARDERMLDLARALSLTWWVRANGTCQVMRDVDVRDSVRATRNLVLLGGPEVNAEARRLERGLRIVARASGVMLAGHAIQGEDLASVHWQESPEHGARRLLIFQAMTAQADGLLGSFNPIGSGHGLPDFVVATGAIRARSWAGFAAAGYWSPDFRLDRRSSWLAREFAENGDSPHLTD